MSSYKLSQIANFSSKPKVTVPQGMSPDGTTRTINTDLLGNQHSLLVDDLGAWVGSDANPLAMSGTVTAELSATDNAVLDGILADTSSLDAKVTACDTGAVVVSSSALPTGCSTAALQSAANADIATLAGTVSAGSIAITAGTALEVKSTYGVGEWMGSTSLADDTFSTVLDVSTYKNVRISGKWGTSIGYMPLFGSSTSGGEYYALGPEDVLFEQVVALAGSPEYHVSAVLTNVPPFLKCYNQSGASVTLELDYIGYAN